MALNYVTVTGTFEDGSGHPLPLTGQSAYCLFTPSTQVFASGVPLITPAQPIQAAISNGALSQSLLATDNAGLSFGGLTGFFYWTVTLVINGQAQAPWSFFLPSSPSTVDLSKLANTAASGGGATLPLTTLGDLLYENATPAAARLPGNTTAAKQFLTQTGTGTVSAAPAWAAIAAGDVPVLNQDTTGKSAKTDALDSATTVVNVSAATAPSAGQALIATDSTHATWQNVPGVQVLTFTFGASGAVPSSGTFTAGTVAVDQNDILRVCTVAGTPGTWSRVGWAPDQFFIDDYGAKGDGKQALVTTVAGSAVINTTPLSPPAAPSLSNSGTGGTIAAGVYQVIVTYVNKWGETVGSSSSSTTTSGTTSTITINSPAPSGNATGWYAYVTQAGGSTYFRQQASGSPSAMEVPLVLTAPPTNTGANPPGADSSAAQVFTSTAVDGGKNIMINGGLGSPGAPWIDTIATVQSATQATLSSNGASQGGNVSQAGCGMVFSSDDRIAIDNCITDAKAYALAHDNFCQVLGSKVYGLGTGLFQSTAPNGATNPGALGYNTQVRIPVGNPSGQTEKLEFQLLGPGDDTHCEFWVSQLPNLNGCTFVSYSVGPNTADPTYGQQSVIGGPQGGVNFNGSNAFANTKAVIRGIRVVQPGWGNSIGIDLQWIAGFVLRGSSVAYAPSASTGGGINPSNGWLSNTFWQAKIGAGLRAPDEGNNDDCIVESLAIEGLTTSLWNQADHLDIDRLATINVYFGIRTSGGDGNTHDLTIRQWSFENVAGGALQNQSGGHITVDVVMDGENLNPVFDIQDNGNNLYGRVLWSDPFRTPGGPANIIAPVVVGAANLEVVNAHLVRQVFGAPTYTLGTAFQNPWWRHMWISLSGGTTTGILIGPTSAACTTSVGTTTPVSFKLPSGWWVNIQGSVKPTTFIAVPD